MCWQKNQWLCFVNWTSWVVFYVSPAPETLTQPLELFKRRAVCSLKTPGCVFVSRETVWQGLLVSVATQMARRRPEVGEGGGTSEPLELISKLRHHICSVSVPLPTQNPLCSQATIKRKNIAKWWIKVIYRYLSTIGKAHVWFVRRSWCCKEVKLFWIKI